MERTALKSPYRLYLDLTGKVILGIVIPAILLRFDPFVFSPRNGDSLVGSFSGAAYVVIVLSMAAFLARVIPGHRPALLSVVLAGAMLPGSLIGFLLGIVILPLSVVGIRLYGLGLLGLYPFIFGVLYLRSARSALLAGWGNDRTRGSEATRGPRRWQMVCGPIAGFVTVIGIAALMMISANRELDRLALAAQRGDDMSRVNWRWERYLTWAGNADRIAVECKQDSDSEHPNDDLAMVYRQLTQRDVEARLYELAHLD